MKIARTIYDGSGRLLLPAGITLTEDFIKRLSSMGIASLYVEEEIPVREVDLKFVVSQRTRTESAKLLKETYSLFEKEKYIDMFSVQKTVDELMDEMLGSYGTLMNFYEIRTYDACTFDHSVNVCILSLLTGITLGYGRQKLRELGISALLHDIGKIKISKELLNKPGALTPDELQQICRHPEEGFNILRRHYEIPLPSAHIALQHQERLDGSGYPHRLTGNEIHEYARVVMVVDVFEALTSDRPYRTAYTVAQAHDLIKSLAGKSFERDFVAALFSNIPPFPTGVMIILSSGEIGQVVKTNKSAPDRPVVKILFDRKKKPFRTPFEIDLSCEPSLSIAKTIPEEDISTLLSGTPREGRSARQDRQQPELRFPRDVRRKDRTPRPPPVKRL